VSTPPEPRHAAADHEPDAPEESSLYAPRTDRSGWSGRGAATLVSRPPEMWAGALFLTLAALPLLVLGGVLALQPGQYGTNLRDEITSSGASMSANTLLLLFRAGGVLLLAIAVALLVLTWRAVRPQRKARLGATVLAAVEAVGLAAIMIINTPDAVSMGMLLLAVAGVVLLYLPRSEEFMYRGR
jgi:hypothetical protein